jgi:hypothetical protein
MRRSLIALAVVAVLVLAASVPASAQTWIQLRYWSSPNSAWDLASPSSIVFSSNLTGFSLRRTLLAGEWAASFNYDTGAFNTYWATPGQFNRFWNFNVHRNFASERGVFSLFAGWGSAAFEWPNWTPVAAYIRQSGLRLGVDAKINVRDQWYLTGSAAYGPFGQATESWAYESTGTFNARVMDWNVGLGRTFGAWGLEGGYRGISWSHDPSVCRGSPCGVRWGGWYVGLNLTMP